MYIVNEKVRNSVEPNCEVYFSDSPNVKSGIAIIKENDIRRYYVYAVNEHKHIDCFAICNSFDEAKQKAIIVLNGVEACYQELEKGNGSKKSLKKKLVHSKK